MSPKIKNSIIFLSIGLVLILVYVFLIKGDSEVPNLVSSSSPSPVTGQPTGDPINQDFLTILLNIQSIKLEDSIFEDPAFLSLKDSSIVITPEGNEGRPNPFAPIGSDAVSPAPTTPTTPSASTTPTPVVNPIPPTSSATTNTSN